MKTKIILLISISISLFSCLDKKEKITYPQYRLSYGNIIPDSNKVKYAEFVTKTVSASNLHMSGGDYEDPEDVVHQIERTGFNIYSRNVEGLEISKCKTCYWVFIEKSALNEKQLIIFDSLNK